VHPAERQTLDPITLANLYIRNPGFIIKLENIICWLFHWHRHRWHNCLLIYLQTVCAMPTHRFVYILLNNRIGTFLRGHTQGDSPEIRTWPRFLYNAPTHQVTSSCV